MAEDTNKTTVPLSQAELDAIAAAEKAEAEVKAQAEENRKIAYKRAMKNADLDIKESTVFCNNAKRWATWGIGIGAVTAGIGILLGAFRH